MPKKTIDDIMDLKYSDEKEKQILMKCLRNLKPFAKYPLDVEIPMDMVEKFINKVTMKYEIRIGYIFFSLTRAEGGMWTMAIRELASGVYLDTIHAITMYELMSKAAIRLNYAVKNGEIRERTRKAEII